MPTQIQFKRGPVKNIGSLNLTSGEPAFITDTGKFYIGDGSDKILINPIDKPVGINTVDSFTKVKVNEYGQVITTENISESDIPDISYTKITGLGTVVTKDTGVASGNIPILDENGKLASSTMPSIAITDTYVVASESEMLALANVEVGDIAVRSDINKTFILQKSPSSVLSNWIELATPTDSVTSVNGQTGVVSITPTNLIMSGYSKPGSTSEITDTDSILSSIGKLEKRDDLLAPINSPTFTGTPKSVTTITSDSSTNIATTAFVQTNISALSTVYAPIASPSFTGTPIAPTATAGTNTTQVATTAFVQTALSTIDGGTF